MSKPFPLFLKVFLLLFFIVLIGGLLIRGFSRPIPTATPEQKAIDTAKHLQAGAMLVDVAGSVTLTRGDKRMTIQKGMELFADDHLNLDQASGTSITITWPTFGQTKCTEGSMIDIENTFVSTDHERMVEHLRLKAGSCWTRLEKPLSPDSEMRFSFQDRFVNILQNAGVSIENDQKTHIRVLAGTVYLNPMSDSTKPLELQADQEITLPSTDNKPESLTSSGPLQNWAMQLIPDQALDIQPSL